MAVVVEPEIEEALRRINALAAFYDETRRALTPGPSGRLTCRSGTDDQRTLQETVIVRCVSVLEALFQDLGTRLVDERLAKLPPEPDLIRLVQHLRDHRLARLPSGAWHEVVELWRDGLGVDMTTSFRQQSSLVALRTTRHAIVHRLGAMTEQYRKQHRQQLEALGMRTASMKRIPLSDADVRAALTLCRNCVRWLHDALTD